MKKLIALALIVWTSVVFAGGSGSCGTKISCKAGEQARCEMANGSTTIFNQTTFLNLVKPTELFLSDIYSYKTGNVGVVDCYYSDQDNWLLFKTTPFHNVIPRDNDEWITRHDTLYCDPDLHSCLLYILY